MQAEDDVAPTTEEYFPASQLMHVRALLELKVPAAHRLIRMWPLQPGCIPEPKYIESVAVFVMDW